MAAHSSPKRATKVRFLHPPQVKIAKSLLRIFLGTLFVFGVSFLVLYIINKPKNVPNNMYVHAGTFDILFGNKLKIDNTSGLINYSIFDSKESLIISNRYHFSDYQRWYIVSDEEGSIWVHSSDIGDVLYKRSTDNKFTEINLTSKLCKVSPDSFKNNLPDSLKTLWNCGIVEK